MDILNTCIMGIVSGVIASICFSLFLLLLKPRVKISDKICVEFGEDNKKSFKVKIVNKTRFMISNIKYSLEYCKMYEDGIHTTDLIEPCKSPLFYIKRFTRNKNDTDYAVRISYNIDATKYPLDENSKLIFTFMATHSLSNTTTCIIREYYAKDIVDGFFESDESIKILYAKH